MALSTGLLFWTGLWSVMDFILLLLRQVLLRRCYSANLGDVVLDEMKTSGILRDKTELKCAPVPKRIISEAEKGQWG